MCAMDTKLNQPRLTVDAPIRQTSKRKSIFGYIQELKDELKKVSWTSKEELKFATKAVVGAIFIFGMGIYLFDLVIKGCLDFVARIVHFIFG